MDLIPILAFVGFVLVAGLTLLVALIQNGGFKQCQCRTSSHAEAEAEAKGEKPPKQAWDGQKNTDPDAGVPISFDPDFKGPKPQQERQLQNCGATGLVGLYILGMLAVLVYSLVQGNYQQLIYGQDLNGDYCGVNHGSSKDYSSKKYLSWPDPVATPSAKYCVSECPGSGVTTSSYDGGSSWTSSWATTRVLNRCLPNSCSASWSSSQCSDAKATVRNDFPNYLKRFFIDCATMDGMVGMALGLCVCIATNLGFSLSIPRLTGGSVKCIYFGAVALMAVFSLTVIINTGNVGGATSLSFSVSQEDQYAYLTLFFGFGVLLLMLVMLLFGCHLNKNSDLVEFVMREAQVPFGAIPRYIWVPVLPTVCVLGIAASFVLTVVFLMGMADSTLGILLGGFQLYGVLLVLELTHMLSIATVSGAVGSWYWSTTADLKVVPDGECCRSFRRALCLQSFGALARASFSFSAIRFPLGMLQALRAAADPEGGLPGCQVCAHSCCCLCLPLAESTKMVDERACIQVAMHGSCWQSSKTISYGLWYRNRQRVDFASAITRKMLFVVGSMSVVLAAMVTFGWLAYDADIYSPTGPTILVTLFANAITSVFTTLYQYTIETIMECFCEDQERNDGSFMRQYYMTPGLKQLLLKDLHRDIVSEKLEEDFEELEPEGESMVEELDNFEAIKMRGMDQAHIDEMEELSLYYIPASTPDLK